MVQETPNLSLASGSLGQMESQESGNRICKPPPGLQPLVPNSSDAMASIQSKPARNFRELAVVRENQPTKQTVETDSKRLQTQMSVEQICLLCLNPRKPEDPRREEETVKSNITV